MKAKSSKMCVGACLHHSPSHGVGFIALPLPALLALPDVALLAPIVQAITPHAVASELTGRLLLSTRLAHLPMQRQRLEAVNNAIMLHFNQIVQSYAFPVSKQHVDSAMSCMGQDKKFQVLCTMDIRQIVLVNKHPS